ncbi:hypothetical protein phiST2_0103 [Vibrio phage phi-ST2]|nr:hypothetical protein phiST2_0103 [Vibrio phage phi-ST2]
MSKISHELTPIAIPGSNPMIVGTACSYIDDAMNTLNVIINA